MKTALVFCVLMFAVAPMDVQAQTDASELVLDGERFYKRGLVRRSNLTPFSGEAIFYNPDKSIIFARAKIRDGEVVCLVSLSRDAYRARNDQRPSVPQVIFSAGRRMCS